MTEGTATTDALDPRDVELIVSGRHADPHRILGRHDGRVRAYRPGAQAMAVIARGERHPMARVGGTDLFEGPLPREVDDYRFEARYRRDQEDVSFVFDDPYRSWPTVGDLDLHLFGEGRHRRLWEVLGA
ncbi:MAG: hypothetical protein J2P58_14570, partial [Acidimicrobiaceae bacterium]|nr:hypothetical protein [Acidimicrobiaceae bacterium]